MGWRRLVGDRLVGIGWLVWVDGEEELRRQGNFASVWAWLILAWGSRIYKARHSLRSMSTFAICNLVPVKVVFIRVSYSIIYLFINIVTTFLPPPSSGLASCDSAYRPLMNE